MKKVVKEVKTLFENPWISLKTVLYEGGSDHGYVFSHETRCMGEIVAIVPFKKVTDFMVPKYQFLLRSEITPSWHPTDYILSSITGGIEDGEPSQDAAREVKEETGYNIEPRYFIPLGQCRGGKSVDTIYHLFTVDLTGREQGEITGDGSGLEVGGGAKWVTIDDIADCVDPIVSTIIMRWGKRTYSI